MTEPLLSGNRIRQRRVACGLTQAELANRAGISRSAITAMEGGRIVPSVAAALSLSRVLELTVEQLFGNEREQSSPEVWAWKSASAASACWEAEVNGRSILYPVDSAPMLTPLPDRSLGSNRRPAAKPVDDTLVMACCDPAAGFLASQFAASAGMRLIVLPRSSRQSVQMLREGLVHLAGLHLSTSEEPQRNVQVIRETLGSNYQIVRLARWQEGVAVAPSASVRSIRGALKANLRWIGREIGSGARQCLDRVLEHRPSPRQTASHHRGVVEAIQSGWADAGVCVELVSAEAGLKFFPVQQEAFDVCFPSNLADDRRIKAFLKVIRWAGYRKLIGELPGYSTDETGETWLVN